MKELWLEFQPLGRRVAAREGESVLQAAHRAGIEIVSICGGEGTCGQCRVRILQGMVSSPTPAESTYLGEKELAAGFRLGCQAQIKGNLRISVPPESLEGEQRLQIAGKEREVAPEPLVRGYGLQLEVPRFGDLAADRERVIRALVAQHGLREVTMDFAALRALPRFLRKTNWQGEVFVRNGEVISFGRPGAMPLGMAIDLGTTKLAFYLVDLASGKTLASEGAMNPQLLYGEDVMARIAYASQEAEGGRVQQSLVTNLTNQVVDRMCRVQGLTSSQVVDVVVVGNTAMHHLFLGLPVEQLGVAPYLAAASSAVDVKARELGLELAPGAWVHALPNVAGFVGADHVAMILASELDAAEGVVVGLDIGTNTEVVLARDGEMVSCSCASGPAFEGGHILHGMRAASGAIERMEMAAGQLIVGTIDGQPAVGICGSGILDAVAVLYSAGALNYRGRMQADHPLVRRGERGLEVVLVEGAVSGTERDIVITQEDINQIQLAKGAIRAGMDILLRAMGVDLTQVQRVVIAGAFGMYIHPESAVQIGMFPNFPRAEFEQIGNAAGMGAKLALLSRRERARAQQIAARIRYIELMSQPNFMEDFALSMYLPR